MCERGFVGGTDGAGVVPEAGTPLEVRLTRAGSGAAGTTTAGCGTRAGADGTLRVTGWATVEGTVARLAAEVVASLEARWSCNQTIE